MNTVDKLLEYLILNSIIDTINISKLDRDSLHGLYKSVVSSSYITKNQGGLLIRILKSNIDLLQSSIPTSLLEMIENPIFEKEFRVLQSTKKLYIQNTPINGQNWDDHLYPLIIAHISHANDALKYLQQSPLWIKDKTAAPSNTYTFMCSLTEQNVVDSVNQLRRYNFEVTSELENLYNTITSWDETEVRNQFLLTSIKNQNFQKHITNDIGAETSVDELIINDRRIRYQYITPNEFPANSLTEIIANRPTPRVWVDNTKYTIKDILASLIILKRLPVLVVFGSSKETELTIELNQLASALDSFGIYSGIGIYFRLPNSETGRPFNDFISNRQYNCTLDNNTQVVGIGMNKLPKFLLSQSWTPMSVVTLNGTLRHSKTAVYANNCDLIISYSANEPLIETRNQWEFD